jgi:hypothetical protein
MSGLSEFIDVLRSAGYDAEWGDTGGGCTAIRIEITPEREILITDAPNSLCGEEAYISTPAERAEKLAAKRAETGYAYAGISGDGSGFLVGWTGWDETGAINGLCIEANDAVAEDLPALVGALLVMVTRRIGSQR